MPIDIHTHCDTTDAQNVRLFADLCEKQQTRVCVFSVGPRSDHTYCDNEAVMSVARQYADIIIPFAFVNLWDSVDSNCVAALRRAGFQGLKCTSPYYPYDHDLYLPVYAQAEELRMPIVFHTGNYRPNAGDRTNLRPVLTNMQPTKLDRIARAFPDLKIVMAHMGTSMFRREAAEMLKLHPNVYADLAGCGSWKALQPSELADLLRPPLATADTEFTYFAKLVLGSDAYTSIPDIVGQAQRCYRSTLESIGVPAALQDNIMGNTVASWLSET